MEKSEIIPLGPNRHLEIILPNNINMLKVNKNPFKTLGIIFCTDTSFNDALNLENRLSKIKNLIKIWKQRNLSWIGRIMIIKTLIISQITHLLSAIYIPDKFLKEMDKLIFSFLWNNKPARIKRETITASISEGGLKMVDIFTFHSAQKSMWVKRLLANDASKWSHLFRTVCGISKTILGHKLSNNCL